MKVLSKGIIKNYNVIINRNNVYDQSVDSDIKWFKEIRKLTTEEDGDHVLGCFLDHNCIKKHY